MNKSELFFRSLWLLLKRSGRDARARQALLRIGFVLLGIVGYALFLRRSLQETGPALFAFDAILLLLAMGVGYFIRRGYARDDESLLSLSTRQPVAPSDLAEHRHRIAAELLHLAAMVDRAGTEALHRQQQVAPENIGNTRRRALNCASKPEVWEIVPEADRELLRSAEGSWEWETIWPWITRSEDVRVLRWVLGIDQVLTPFEFLRSDLTVAVELTLRPDRVNGDVCLAAYDLRPEQTIAQTMVARCIAEGIQRGLLDETDVEARRQMVELAENMGSGENADLLAGSETVGQAKWDRIIWLGQAALRRTRVLTALIGYLNSSRSYVRNPII